jgi:hypothetical protein
MPNRYRSNDVALGLTALICTVILFYVGWSYIELKTQQRVSEYYERQGEAGVGSGNIALACAGMPPDAFAECVIQQYEEAQQWERERRDLYAQEAMALWAAWMFFITAAAFAAILRTLHHTRRAADYAADMVKADRAWMSFGSIEPRFLEPDGFMGFDVKWTNCGRSPALDVVAVSAIGFGEHGEPPPTFTRRTSAAWAKSSPVGPSLSHRTLIDWVDDKKYESWRRREIRMFAYSIIHYTDVYDRDAPRFTESCFEMIYIRGTGTDIDFMILPAGEQNCAG